MAQYYHILDYKGLPVSTQAALVSGLPYYARVKAKIRGDSGFSTEETLLAVIADKLAMLVWLNSEDGRNNTNRPRSILAALSGGDSGREYSPGKEKNDDRNSKSICADRAVHARIR